MTIFNVLTMIGGLCLFLFGMDLMGQALERRAGGKLRTMLDRMTGRVMTGFLTGLGITAVIQSSSATTVMVVGFVNSGLMTLRQAINVIMGANVGTTVTAWLLSMAGISSGSVWINLLKPTSFTPVLALVGIIFYMFCKNGRKKDTGMILLGFATLMFGMDTMSGAVAGLKDVPAFAQLFIAFKNPVLGVLAGAVLTGIIQSSSASVGILQALAVTGQVSYAAAIPIIMGQNIGTCVTALLSSVGANKNARRAAVVHLMFNVIGVAVLLTVFCILKAVFEPGILHESATMYGIAIAHSCFNIICTAMLLPCGGLLEKLAILTVPDSKDQAGEQHSLLDERLLSTPSVAVGRAMLTGGDMAEICRTSLLQAMSLTHKWDEAIADEVNRKEDAVDHYEDVLGTYLVKLSAKALSREDNRTINTLLHTINDLERISDHSVNLLKAGQEIQEKSIHFSHEAIDDLSVLEAAVQDIVNRTVDAFQKNDCYAAGKIEPLEQVVDGLVREVKTRHIARLQAGACTIEYGFVLDDLLTNYERIADHCSNIAVAMIEVSEDRFDTHEYLNHIKNGESPSFEKRYERYRGRYTFEPGPSGTAAVPEQKK